MFRLKYAISWCAALMILIPSAVFSGSEHNLAGFAWSSNIGWVSLNSLNDHDSVAPGTQTSPINYGVTVDPITGDLSGYAWSSNIGWIQFGGLSGFPTGPGTVSANARLSGSGITGWAKALAADGIFWDGWVSLSGTGYGIARTGATISGYAWAGEVMGWVDFSWSTFNPDGFPDISLDARMGGVSVNGRPDVEYGSDISLVWTLSNVPSNTSCSVSKTSSGGTSFSPVSGITTDSMVSAGSLSAGTYEYEMVCSGDGGYSDARVVSFSVLSAQPGFSIGGNEQVRIRSVDGDGGESEEKIIHVIPYGGYAGDVTLSVGGIYPALSASTTIEYSFGGGPFSSDPSLVVPAGGLTSFKVRTNRQIENACISVNNPVGCVWHDITINATGSGVPPRNKIYRIIQSSIRPVFQEI